MEDMHRDEMIERVFATVAMARGYCVVVVLDLTMQTITWLMHW